jgi:pimeloyl-ACP methyl ester carboxylesterase
VHARPQAAYGVGIEASLREIRVGGYPVRYEVAGEGGEPIVLVHGLSGSTRWWARNLPARLFWHGETG